jgi:hypothetical protein
MRFGGEDEERIRTEYKEEDLLDNVQLEERKYMKGHIKMHPR